MITGRVLVAEDDAKTAELIRLYLERDGHSVIVAGDGRKALELARQKQPDLILLDVMMPSLDGLDICRILRHESDIPIVMVTARSTEDDMLLGLDLGVDDYITKPFSPRILAAKVRAVLRRTRQAEEKVVLHVGNLTIDTERHEARLSGEQLDLTPKEFKLLATMAASEGKAFSRQELLDDAFGFGYEGLDRTVDVHVMNIRKKIEPDIANPRYLHTVYGVGYKLEDAQDE